MIAPNPRGLEPHLETEVVRASFYKRSIDYLAGRRKVGD